MLCARTNAAHEQGRPEPYIQRLHGIFGRESTKHTVIYGVYMRSWPTLLMSRGVHVSDRTTKAPSATDLHPSCRVLPPPSAAPRHALAIMIEGLIGQKGVYK
jgi:hypothetical protein